MPCSPRMTKCTMRCLHRQTVEEYRAAREAAEQRREAETLGYARELAMYPPIITFKDWLVQTAGRNREENYA